MSYRPVQDFEHITILATPTTVLVINPALPFKNVPELIAYA
ncbi:MAG: tripartite tricarboxylate transporter substrate binding protein, partial [Actinobacteria bacterium]|nr:tripartite tricarboxylate transporter substrate binding protein [Actinomycetota bacterium]